MNWPEAIFASSGVISAGAVMVALFMAAGGKWNK